ncbi:MAG: glycosyltransferase family 2 protein, partial [Planctomycetia bacterium]
MAPPAPTSLTGVLERIIFFNEENHYTIAEFRPDADRAADPAAKVTIVGALPGVECGETLHLDGPEALALAHEKAWGDAAGRPFCFVLLQFNTPEVTARCVASIRRLEASGRRIHIVIVDNASSTDAIARTKALFGAMPDVSLLFNRENLGFARGNNVGYRHAREVLGADFIAVLNNDTVIEDPAFVAKCVALFRKWSYSVLGPDIVTPDGRHENPWNDFVYDAASWGSLQQLFERQREAYRTCGKAEFRRLGSRSPGAREILDPVLQGAAYVFSPVFTRDRPRPFDDRTFLYGEEFLLAADCLLAGHPMLYSSELAIAHEEGVSTRSIPDDQKIMRGYDGAIGGIALARSRIERHAAAA